jgi:hypothetical protein
MESLPTSRQLLTSLITTLTSETAVSQQTFQDDANRPVTATTNPLSQLNAQSKGLLTTLHALYPSLLLPALDLLDRKLVTRVLVLDTPSSSASEASQACLDASAPSFYIVRSAQQQKRGRRWRGGGAADGETGHDKTYMVRTTAWNCSCAAFAFSAFPAGGGGNASEAKGYVIDDDHVAFRTPSGTGPEWEFGGLSEDGKDGGPSSGVPCCKHLLACVLAERWSIVRDNVEERRVGREEAAGLVGGT